MNKIIRRSIPFICCVIAAACIFYFATDAKPSASSPQDQIASTFSNLSVMDAEFVEQVSDPGKKKDGCLLYTSDSTQMGYYFDPETGVLTDILHYSRIGGTYSEQLSSASALTPMQAAPENRTDALLQYAKLCIGNFQIGELQIETKQDQGELHRYTVTELYDGIETGTTVQFSCTPAGQITMVNVAIGSIFEPAKDGTYVIAGGSELIGEEAAVEIARTGLVDRMAPSYVSDLASCKLDAAEDQLVYTVEIPFTDEEGLSHIYSAAINAHTGELWQESVTK